MTLIRDRGEIVEFRYHLEDSIRVYARDSNAFPYSMEPREELAGAVVCSFALRILPADGRSSTDRKVRSISKSFSLFTYIILVLDEIQFAQFRMAVVHEANFLRMTWHG